LDICDFNKGSLVVITGVLDCHLREIGFLEGKKISIEQMGNPCIVRFDSGMKVAIGDGVVFAKGL
jgi:Fe2+ transport system protein FeoA